MSPDYFNGSNNPVADAIDRAEIILDPLDGLAMRTAVNPGAPFESEALTALRMLKAVNPAAFEAVRGQLKKAGCRVTTLDTALADKNADVGAQSPKQADILLELTQSAELFHTPAGQGFADLHINGHRETWPIRSRGFRDWLTRCYYEDTGGAPNSEALKSALNTIEAKARYDGQERLVHIRVGKFEGLLYLDLCNDKWQAVEIDGTGWRVVDNPPVRFRRTSGMMPIPVPRNGGSIELLRAFLNVESDADFVLVVCWLLACLRNYGPYPLIVSSGEQGSAKSTFAAILRALVDPNTAPLRALPRENHDLFIAANNGHVLAFDNISGLTGWISDTLCRLATGGGFATRQLYSDQDEVLFHAQKPIILNGIEDIVTRPDLADRALFLTLRAIPEERRRSEHELWLAFETERPLILGVLLDAVAKGLAMLPSTKLDKMPRMADFAVWASACEPAFWPAGTFWAAYTGNRDGVVDAVLDADPIAGAIRALILTRGEWTGTATELLRVLAELADDRQVKSMSWPDGPRALGSRLRRAATFLRTSGINIDFAREGQGRTRSISITTSSRPSEAESEGNRSTVSSASSASLPIADDTDIADANPPTQSAPDNPGWRARL